MNEIMKNKFGKYFIKLYSEVNLQYMFMFEWTVIWALHGW